MLIKDLYINDYNFDSINQYQKTKYSNILNKILITQNIEPNQIQDYLNPKLASLLHPNKLLNNTEAAKLTVKHIQNKAKIVHVCDYDVDGLTSGSVLSLFFKELNLPLISLVPDRFKDGYGLSNNLIDQCIELKAELLITSDLGSTNVNEIKRARENNIDVIVIDHHHISENIPNANFIVNPHNKDCNFAESILPAVALTWYFVAALKNELSLESEFEKVKDIDIKNYLDLVLLGVICDMVPLKGMNRLFAKKGIELINNSKNLGIKAIISEIKSEKKKITPATIGFQIGPRINAAGRMSDPSQVIDLFSLNEESKCRYIARNLSHLNKKRQNIEKQMTKRIDEEFKQLKEIPFGIVSFHPENHTGIIGIAAQKLMLKYGRPSIVLGTDGKYYKGSVRGVKGFSVIDTLTELSDYFKLNDGTIKFGGHAAAGGLSILEENLNDFKIAFDSYCKKFFDENGLVPKSYADIEIELKDINLRLIKEINLLEPFGIGNPKPIFHIKNLRIKNIKSLNGGHKKIVFTNEKKDIEALIWNTEMLEKGINIGAVVDINGKLSINEYNGNQIIQINIDGLSLR